MVDVSTWESHHSFFAFMQPFLKVVDFFFIQRAYKRLRVVKKVNSSRHFSPLCFVLWASPSRKSFMTNCPMQSSWHNLNLASFLHVMYRPTHRSITTKKRLINPIVVRPPSGVYQVRWQW